MKTASATHCISTIHCVAISTPLGPLYATADANAITGLYFEGQKYFPATLPALTSANAVLAQLQTEIAEYFAGRRRAFTAPLEPHGTPFQRQVWQLLQAIPCGATLTYGDLAARLGKPSAVRAVAGAVGRNPISVVIPCHRIIGKDGSLTGYAGGLDRKAALLRLETLPAKRN